MARNGVYFVLNSLKGLDPDQLEKTLLHQSREFGRIAKVAKENLAQSGAKIVKDKKIIFTHCHSSSVEKVLVEARKEGGRFQVINTETRPLFQGRITARHLLKAGIPVTMVIDSAGALMLSSTYPTKIDMMIIGADAVLEDGSVMNKIGSYGLSLVAKKNHIPVYVVASLLKYYPYPKIEIEKRPAKEIWPQAPRKLKIINLAFDRVPAHYIQSFITEVGVIKPQEFSSQALKTYLWLK